MILIKNVEIYSPEDLGKKDILIGNNKIMKIADNISFKSMGQLDGKTIDGEGKIAIPGFIDHHIHFNGAGGEGGAKFRTPPLKLSELTQAGITSAVGLLGTDGVTRSLKDLLMKARGLEQEGISTWIYTGSYQYPSPTITESVIKDITTIDKVIGVKLALSDHRSSHPTIDDLRKILSETRTGGILSGDAGIVNIHMGDEEAGLSPVLRAINGTDIPLNHLAPTHMSRNEKLIKESIEFAKQGGYIDITASDISSKDDFSIVSLVKRFIDSGVPLDQIKMSTDAGGSLPEFNEAKELIGIRKASPKSMYKSFVKLAKTDDIGIEGAVKISSTNISEQLDLQSKGMIEEGKDADIIILDSQDYEIESLISGGDLMILDGEVVEFGTFE